MRSLGERNRSQYSSPTGPGTRWGLEDLGKRIRRREGGLRVVQPRAVIGLDLIGAGHVPSNRRDRPTTPEIGKMAPGRVIGIPPVAPRRFDRHQPVELGPLLAEEHLAPAPLGRVHRLAGGLEPVERRAQACADPRDRLHGHFVVEPRDRTVGGARRRPQARQGKEPASQKPQRRMVEPGPRHHGADGRAQPSLGEVFGDETRLGTLGKRGTGRQDAAFSSGSRWITGLT